jgi:hypothetical protein
MRFSLLCALLALFLVASSSAQDTNFATGPQYLAHGSPLYAHSISTPAMSFSAPALEVGASNATEGLIAGADTRTVTPQRKADADLFPVYYGTEWAGPVEVGVLPAPSPAPLPAPLQGTGVSQITTAQALRDRGYGVTLPVAAARAKAHEQHATRLYTNADIERLRGGS